jgi:hypothetical protein
MKELPLILLWCSFAFAQGIGGSAGMGGKAGFGGGAPSGAAPSVVQSAVAGGAFGTNPSTTITFASVTSGNILVVFSGVGTLTSWNAPTGTGVCSGLSWTSRGSPTTVSPSGNLWTATLGSSGACTVTVSGNSSGGVPLVGLGYEVTNGTTTGLVISPYTGTAGCSSCTGNAVTTIAPNTLVLTFIGYGSSATLSAPSPFSFDINANNGQGEYNGAGHYLQVSAGTYTPTWTSNNSPVFANVSVGLP